MNTIKIGKGKGFYPDKLCETLQVIYDFTLAILFDHLLQLSLTLFLYVLYSHYGIPTSLLPLSNPLATLYPILP